MVWTYSTVGKTSKKNARCYSRGYFLHLLYCINIHIHDSRSSCFCTAARANTQQTQNVKVDKFRAQRLPRYRYSGVYKAHSRSTAFQSSLFPAFIFVQKIFQISTVSDERARINLHISAKTCWSLWINELIPLYSVSGRASVRASRLDQIQPATLKSKVSKKSV